MSDWTRSAISQTTGAFGAWLAVRSVGGCGWYVTVLVIGAAGSWLLDAWRASNV